MIIKSRSIIKRKSLNVSLMKNELIIIYKSVNVKK